ncbi:hypothetical protein M9H77_26634 [Catharanthus roseus]|uniref:Uncharacterized protein n=1 Tax=Catharanthus roseus TaxID=4058 RepID=A0ACC0AEA9_CATRO|nr:hypothetical protein M9H77_26634 [Catharanthus roseus]
MAGKQSLRPSHYLSVKNSENAPPLVPAYTSPRCSSTTTSMAAPYAATTNSSDSYIFLKTRDALREERYKEGELAITQRLLDMRVVVLAAGGNLYIEGENDEDVESAEV